MQHDIRNDNPQAQPTIAPRSGFRSFLLNVAVIAATFLLVAGVLEVVVRVMFARSLDFSMEMWKYATTLKQPVADPNLSFAHRPNSSAFLMGVPVSTNSHGLRDREYPETKPAGVYRILMLGDSTTLGWGAPVENTVAKTLERRLNQGCPAEPCRYEVLNAGVGNYGTVQEYTHYMTYDRAFHPDMVILQYFINDPEPVPTERPGLIGHSYLLAFAVSRFDGMLRLTGKRPNWKDYYAGLYREDQPGLHPAEAALGDLAAATKKDGAQLLVTILPELHQINDEYPFVREEQKIKDVLAADRVPAMDLRDGLKGHGPENTLWVTPADDHPNGKAASLIVDQLTPWVTAHSGPASNPGQGSNLHQ